ncbi:putative uncharacterized protein [Parachlamydia acanthamoebae UV-7]|uniref:Heparin-sulfate lyase N-terminal domain-containing protein n=2 Tax=Parachlamydia acanthamoebae TaxID=83552 RepID=F8KZD0_PARAV|nr:hypothetical protein [Parachlamydia acanthamoebae]KIA77995.1 hypothetical protein DB43_FF00140 [Parachlamydia acanthamoebae]CCB86269.1 putative uncharacterized protein [Parachlamydia acanthamoebae UV-7]
MTNLDLKNLQAEQCKDLYHSSLRTSLIYATLNSQFFDFGNIHHFDDLLTSIEDYENPFEIISEGHQLFTLALIGILNKDCPPPYSIWLQEKIENFRQIKVWEEFQLATALKSVLGALIGEPVILPKPSQLKSGAAFLEWKGLWSWGKTTHGRFHADLGFFWAILGHLKQEPSLIEAAQYIAKWHLNTLNPDYSPIRGLFVLEENASLKHHLISNYLLFQAIAVLTDDSNFGLVAARQLDYLQEYVPEGLPDDLLLVHMYLSQIGNVSPSEAFSLDPWVFDQEVGLIGCRSAKNTVLCAGNGGQTGLGYIKQAQVEIVNYGPQFFPLGDCQGFGVEGSRFQSNLPAWKMNLSENGFRIKSTLRLTPQQMDMQSLPNFRNGLSSKVWAEVEQSFAMQENTLSISANFVSLDQVHELAFVFFVSAESCSVEEGATLYPKTFAHYRGTSELIQLKKGDSILLIETPSVKGDVEVIPLAGEDNFWGADFLIAYRVDSSQQIFHWDIHLN